MSKAQNGPQDQSRATGGKDPVYAELAQKLSGINSLFHGMVS